MKQFASYLRVSTQKQGKTMLGIEAQRKMCSDFIVQHKGQLAQEFIDIESGTHRDRKGLQSAINYCKDNCCPLVIAKLDRLARDVEFCFRIVNTGVEIHFCDMPQMNTLLLGVFASVAQYERELTSDRTKKALAVKKAQGCRLGAASDKYKETYNKKTKETKDEEQMKRGVTKNRRYLESRDTQTMFRVLKRVFPDVTQGEPQTWDWSRISTANGAKDIIYSFMKDYKDYDDTHATFHSWDFDDVSEKPRYMQQRLASYIRTIRDSVLLSVRNNDN